LLYGICIKEVSCTFKSLGKCFHSKSKLSFIDSKESKVGMMKSKIGVCKLWAEKKNKIGKKQCKIYHGLLATSILNFFPSWPAASYIATELTVELLVYSWPDVAAQFTFPLWLQGYHKF